eukprot:TRINITY_DN15866_c0_g1_i7.p1 TRINITY_DN15866_c0_g1~~TRINITY_DN15866_c0_g1_i7.p1  ORF type:complete len:748 (+),score=156.82 TRINITY_DN15866_c0_g1_i7:51-2246(+)
MYFKSIFVLFCLRWSSVAHRLSGSDVQRWKSSSLALESERQGESKPDNEIFYPEKQNGVFDHSKYSKNHIKEGSSKGLAVIIGQTKNSDGSVAYVVKQRAQKAKELLESSQVEMILASGGDHMGSGETLAQHTFDALLAEKVEKGAIEMESQSLSLPEAAYFTLRWIPKDTGQLYVVTSDFQIARAMYVFNSTLNAYYDIIDTKYAEKHNGKKSPRLQLHAAPTQSFCGETEPSKGDTNINLVSLKQRARDELEFVASGEVKATLTGENAPSEIWRMGSTSSLEEGRVCMVAQAATVAVAYSKCSSPPDEEKYPDKKMDAPLTLPLSCEFPEGLSMDNWKEAMEDDAAEKFTVKNENADDSDQANKEGDAVDKDGDKEEGEDGKGGDKEGDGEEAPADGKPAGEDDHDEDGADDGGDEYGAPGEEVVEDDDAEPDKDDFDKIDTNGNGVIDKKEWNAAGKDDKEGKPLSLVIGPIVFNKDEEVAKPYTKKFFIEAFNALVKGVLEEGKAQEFVSYCTDASSHPIRMAEDSDCSEPYWLREVWPSKAIHEEHLKKSVAFRSWKKYKEQYADWKREGMPVNVPAAAKSFGVVTEEAFLKGVMAGKTGEDFKGDLGGDGTVSPFPGFKNVKLVANTSGSEVYIADMVDAMVLKVAKPGAPEDKLKSLKHECTKAHKLHVLGGLGVDHFMDCPNSDLEGDPPFIALEDAGEPILKILGNDVPRWSRERRTAIVGG